MNKIFDVDYFNLIEDEENYYFIRALNNADSNDLKSGIILDENKNITRIRTDRERFVETNEGDTPKYKKESKISLEEVFDHIKMHYRKDTNCVSLSSNANVSISYGRGYYNNEYALIKVPKKEMGKKVINAGQYMLEQVESKIEEFVNSIEDESTKNTIKEVFQQIERAEESSALKIVVQKKFTSNSNIPKISQSKTGIICSEPTAIISSYDALNDEQLLEKNKIIVKLTYLEKHCGMPPIIPRAKKNLFLISTIGNAFSSLELIHYGEIDGQNVIIADAPYIDLLALLQQIDVNKASKMLSKDTKKVQESITNLKKIIVEQITQNKEIELPNEIQIANSYIANVDVAIDEMYERTNGRIAYGDSSTIIKNAFGVARARYNARMYAKILESIVNKNESDESKENLKAIISYMEKYTYAIDHNMITRKSEHGIKISESVSLDIKPNENNSSMINTINDLDDDSLMKIISSGGTLDVNGILSDNFSKIHEDEQISLETYYAEAIVSLYNWKKIGIESFTIDERKKLVKKLKEEHCMDLYKMLEKHGVQRSLIPTIILNMAALKKEYNEKYDTANENIEEIKKQKRLEQYEEVINNNFTEQHNYKNNFTKDMSIEKTERLLGYYDIENTESRIKLRKYQKRSHENANKIFENNRFASVILPTGGGKSFVALAQMMQHKNEKMLYLAPQYEIIDQMKDYIIEYLHEPTGKLGKSKDQLVAEVFPNLKFLTYAGLNDENIQEKYDFIILDELHRTGAEKWGANLNKLLENQDKSTKVLGITATPRRDADGKNMSIEIAQKLGYTNEEAIKGKHIATNISLPNAIRMGIVVNPKLVLCGYNLLKDGSMEQLKADIESIEDIEKRNNRLKQYEDLRKNLENAEGISEILKKNVKKGGRYIVFLPMNEEYEDEDGNKKKKFKRKRIVEYENKIREYLTGSGLNPKFHSMLGIYSDKENQRQLEEFQSEDSENVKFMLVLNKANEGLHLNKINGIIWMRSLDENSRIVYLQQLGRIIYSEDPDNPTEEEDRPVVIDLVNNTLKVDWDDDITEQDDIELLELALEWYRMHDDTIPNINSTDKEESGYAKILKELQNKYRKYIDGNFGKLEEKQRIEIEYILELGSEMDLWESMLPDKITSNGNGEQKESTKLLGHYELVGFVKDFIELKENVESEFRSSQMRNILRIKKWCEDRYGDKPIWERRKPYKLSDNAYERKLGHEFDSIERTMQRKKDKDLTEEETEIKRLYLYIKNNYGLSRYHKRILAIQNWCEVKYEDKPIWERHLPSTGSDEKYEAILGRALHGIKQKIIKKDDNELNEEEREIKRIYLDVKNNYGLSENLKNILAIQNWCIDKYGDKPIWERCLPNEGSENEYEKKLAKVLHGMSQKLMKRNDEGLNEDDIEAKRIYRDLKLNYGLSVSHKIALKIQSWCIGKYGDKPIWERCLPSPSSEDETERKLYSSWLGLSKKLMKMNDEELTEEERETKRIYLYIKNNYGLDVSHKNILAIQNWCEVKYGDKPIWERCLPSSSSKNEYEKKLGSIWISLGQRLMKKSDEELTEEERETKRIYLDIKNSYGLSVNLKNILEIQNWCKDKYKDKPIWERRLPSQTSNDEKERRLCNIWYRLTYEIMTKSDEELTEEERKIAKVYTEVKNAYALGPDYKNILKIQSWLNDKYKDKPIWERCLPNSRSKDEKEKSLYHMWYRITNEIMTKSDEELTEEEQKIKKIYLDLKSEYGMGQALKSVLEIQNWCVVNQEDKPLEERRLPNKRSENGDEKRLGEALVRVRSKTLKKDADKLTDEDIKVLEIIRELSSEYDGKKIKKRDIAIASFESSTEACKKAQDVLNEQIALIQSQHKMQQNDASEYMAKQEGVEQDD